MNSLNQLNVVINKPVSLKIDVVRKAYFLKYEKFNRLLFCEL
jgi:superoxide dismutase